MSALLIIALSAVLVGCSQVIAGPTVAQVPLFERMIWTIGFAGNGFCLGWAARSFMLAAMTHARGERPMSRNLRFRVGRALLHLGLRVLPPGRCRQELSEMMWAWRMKVDATLAAHWSQR